MKRSFDNSPASPPSLQLRTPSPQRASVESLLCKEEMPERGEEPSNLKRKRVLPPWFTRLPEPESDESDDERETLARMNVAVQLVFNDIEERQADNRRETADYNEGDTPQTSQESKLSDYNWSLRDGSDVVPMTEIEQFVWKYLPRQKIYDRVMPFLSVTEEMYQANPARVEEMVRDVLDCEPLTLLNTLEDAIEEAEKVFEREDLPETEEEAGEA